MSDRTIASRLRRIGVCIALPIALAGVSAQAADAQTFHPANATDLYNDVATANSTPGFNVIVLADQNYFPSGSQSMNITGNLEITGPPQLQPSQFNQGIPPTINGQNQATSGHPLFTISPGANVIFKAFNLQQAGGGQWPNTLVNGGKLEVDNMAVAGNIGDGIDVSPATTSMLTVNNSLITSTAPPNVGIVNNATGAQAVLNDDTIAFNQAAGVGGAFTMHNDVFGGNVPDCNGAGAVNTPNTSEDEDGSCNVDIPGGAPNLQASATQGGPTYTSAPGAGSDIIGAGDPSWCERSDQRFYTAPAIPPTSCDLGSYQTGYTLQSDTTGPACSVVFTHNGPSYSPNQQEVSATDAGVAGEGADTISNTVIELKGTTTTNGTVSYPTVPGTLFDETSPGSNILDQPSNAAFDVLAQKPSGDTTAGDTFWSFTATDWFNNATNCQ